MKYKMYTIQDTMIGFGSPFLQKDERLAERTWKNFIEDCRNPEDQRLYYLGEFNDQTGVAEVLNAPKLIQGGQEVR